ncbi:unnamed protein product [Protopolystoma xenopodis]|uniref:Uncharacterized protein n=1 Tax=Protopolystoma xenopodis TaxID=117903 RepID=A0A448X6C9_9PLAT|nr:unnamed protein product [Protopolystoma xenopodis]
MYPESFHLALSHPTNSVSKCHIRRQIAFILDCRLETYDDSTLSSACQPGRRARQQQFSFLRLDSSNVWFQGPLDWKEANPATCFRPQMRPGVLVSPRRLIAYICLPFRPDRLANQLGQLAQSRGAAKPGFRQSFATIPSFCCKTSSIYEPVSCHP